ncbi:WD40 repeat [Kalmanozyma brasiliensis GHG001]|uniref:WD40 repeat n=1 Tax=Kalmanozyma brasiliensis (strain GHG001) TaxID=1365824 RepID=UPI0028681560|nr:WD40 repeat [Kalmanozyma brasiliensis GHG001]KAF6766884.1 WD40 repeat [Kalmanozyma brasiliensis GHG001]
MSLDPSQRSTHQQESNTNSTLSQNQSVERQHDVAEPHEAPGASGILTDPAAQHEQHNNDAGHVTDRNADTDASTIVRVTDPRAVEVEAQNGHADASDEPSAVIDVARLAPELLIRTFAFLDPVSLSRAAAVCRAWALVARDDATWRAAFATYFSLEAAQAHRAASLEVSATPALRRLTNASWRQEFQQRVDLLRQWRKSRTPTVLSTPRVDIIKKISLSKQHRILLSATDTYGVASRSNPWTGKVIKGYLDAEGTVNGAGNGNPNQEFSPNVTSLNMSSDASHIFWGFRSGEVGMTIISRQGANPRGLIRSVRFTPRASHAGPVTAIAIPFASDSDGAHGPGRSPERLRQATAMLGDVASTFVTAGFDGSVRLWSSERQWPLWIAASSTKAPLANAISSGTPDQNNAETAAPLCALAYDAKSGVIVAGSTTGKVFVWTHIDVAALLRIPPEATDPEHLQNGSPGPETLEAHGQFLRLSQAICPTTINMPPGAAAEVAVSSIFIDAASKPTDAGSSAQDCSILVHHSGARVLLRHRISQDPSDSVETTILGAAVMDEITAIRVDFEPRLPKRDPRSTAHSPSISVHASPTLSATKPEKGTTLAIGQTFDTYDTSSQYPERKLVCIGTKSGSLFLFDWESTGSAFSLDTQHEWQGPTPRFQGKLQLLPSIGWEAHHTSITALDMTPLHIFVGTSDGTIKVFDSLAGDLQRTINDRTATRHPARMLAAGELTESEAARFRVTQIIADHECLVASIGHQVLAFKAEAWISKRAAAAAGAGPASKTRGAQPRLSDNKWLGQVELRRDVRETEAELEAEAEEREVEYSKIRNRQGFELEGLSETEALEYALMLSRDEEAATATSKARHMGGAGYVPGAHAGSSRRPIETPVEVVEDPELADALEQIALAESRESTPFHPSPRYRLLEDTDFDVDLDDLDEPSGRPSPSPSPGASPYLSDVSSPPSRAWTILSQAGASATTPAHASDRWGSHSKVRTVNVPRQARLSSPTPAEAMSISSSLGSSVRSPPELHSPRDFPAMESPRHTPAVGGEGLTPGQVSPFFRRGSGFNATSSPASPGPGAVGKWTKSPNLRPVDARPNAWASRSPRASTSGEAKPSLLAESLKEGKGKGRAEAAGEGRPAADADEQDMDEEMRFAIQLSLAEQRSRTET